MKKDRNVNPQSILTKTTFTGAAYHVVKHHVPSGLTGKGTRANVTFAGWDADDDLQVKLDKYWLD